MKVVPATQRHSMQSLGIVEQAPLFSAVFHAIGAIRPSTNCEIETLLATRGVRNKHSPRQVRFCSSVSS